MGIEFRKYHALGNDYIVIDPQKIPLKLTKENIQLICHRNFGIGSDGILYGPLINQDQVALKIFNPDGSEAEKSGNGIRIFSKYLVDEKYIKVSHFSLHTLGGAVDVEILNDKATLIKVDMGEITFQSGSIPVAGRSRIVVNEILKLKDGPFKVTCLSIGNPHCVIPLKKISKDLAVKLGPQVEKHKLFPNRINMQLLKVIDRKNIQIEIWERGAGYTLASGSSSCAAAAAAYKLGLIDSKVKVRMPGGLLEVEMRPDGHVFMTGSVSSVAKGEFSSDFKKQLA